MYVCPYTYIHIGSNNWQFLFTSGWQVLLLRLWRSSNKKSVIYYKWVYRFMVKRVRIKKSFDIAVTLSVCKWNQPAYRSQLLYTPERLFDLRWTTQPSILGTALISELRRRELVEAMGSAGDNLCSVPYTGICRSQQPIDPKLSGIKGCLLAF